MPRQGQTVTGSRQDAVRQWLRANPGHHRCMEIARAMGEPTHPVALACYQLSLQGDAIRGTRQTSSGKGRPFPTYAAAPVPAEEVTTT